jgi:hypothetical protein
MTGADKMLLSARRWYLMGWYSLAIGSGVRTALLPHVAQNVDLALSWATGLALALLIFADAKILGKPLPVTSGWLLLFYWPIAVPACVVSLRKWRGLLLLLLHAGVFWVVMAATYWLCRWLAV